MKLTALHEYQGDVFRNIQGINIGFDEFDDLTDDQESLAYAHQKASSHSDASKNNVQYNAIDFVFSQRKNSPSRFSDGSHPVWYSSVTIETSFHETLYHWRRVFIDSPQFTAIESDTIRAIRSVFSVHCRAAVLDLRQQSAEDTRLIDPDPENYPYTQQIGARINEEGHPALITSSARHEGGENVVVFNKNVLSRPGHYNDYIYEYNISTQSTIVREYHSETEIVLQ